MFETAVVNELSLFEPLKLYCSFQRLKELYWIMSVGLQPNVLKVFLCHA